MSGGQGPLEPETPRVGDLDVDPALASAVLEIEQHASSAGWDQPARLFALVDTADLVRHEPALAAAMGLDDAAEQGSLTAVEQDGLDPTVALERSLETIAWPDGVTQVSNAFRNQFEVPVLFLALVAFAMLTRKADFLFVVLSWIFVISRYVHAFIHVTSNNTMFRLPAFSVGFLVLIVMWIIFAVQILTPV